ncbi:alginate lyase family protein [Pontiellaceae bacterium B12219]|nr:alginate lyase family protein [Pontiellaceae bacterium B12219]
MNRAGLVCGLIAVSGIALAAHPPATLLMDGDVLAQSKERILAGDAEILPAFSNLVEQAEAALFSGPFSVMNKTRVPPSGDKHDYMSFSRYWWPDPTKPDGLPYIRRDGETNPESQGSASDRPRLGHMAAGVETLGLAYYFTGDPRYAEKAAELIRIWFLNPATRMNPNLNFAQGVPGLVDGKKSGILDGRLFCRVLDGVVLLEGSAALSDSEEEGLRAWFAQYLKWLKSNEMAQNASNAENNHGTFFDVQIMYIALFTGDVSYAREIAVAAVNKRILVQIEEDGAQPEELARTRSLFYSLFNLDAMFLLARLAEPTGVDLWHAGDSRIRAGLDFMAPYADPVKPWPYPEIRDEGRMQLLQLLLYAEKVYADESYGKWVEKFPEGTAGERERLVVPLMR